MHLLNKWPSGLAGGHGLHADDLNGVSSGSVPGAHVAVALGYGSGHGEVTVLAVHVVGAATGIVPKNV